MFEHTYSANNTSHSSGELPCEEFQATPFPNLSFHSYSTDEVQATGNHLSPVPEDPLGTSIAMQGRYFNTVVQEYNYYGNEQPTDASDEEVLHGHHPSSSSSLASTFDANNFLQLDGQMSNYAMNELQTYSDQYSPLSTSVQEYGTSHPHADEAANGSLDFEAYSLFPPSQRPSRPTVSVDFQPYPSLDSSVSTPYSPFPPTPASGNGSPSQEIKIQHQQPFLDPRYISLPFTHGSISPVQESSECKPIVATAKVREAATRKRRSPVKYKCLRCGDGFTTKHNWQHHQNAHDGVRPYTCAYCYQTFTVPRSKDRHEKNIHSANKFPS